MNQQPDGGPRRAISDGGFADQDIGQAIDELLAAKPTLAATRSDD